MSHQHASARGTDADRSLPEGDDTLAAFYIDDGLTDEQAARADELAATIPEHGIDTDEFRELAKLYAEESSYELERGSDGPGCTSVEMLHAIGRRAYSATSGSARYMDAYPRVGTDIDVSFAPKKHLFDNPKPTGGESTAGLPDEWSCRCCRSHISIIDTGEAGHSRWCPHGRGISSKYRKKGEHNAHRCPECGQGYGDHYDADAEANPYAESCSHLGEGYVCYWCSESFGEGVDGLVAYADHHAEVHNVSLFEASDKLLTHAFENHESVLRDYLDADALTPVQCEKCDGIRIYKRHIAPRRKYCSKECSSAARSESVRFVCAHCGKREMKTPAEAEERTYCSHECHNAAVRGPIRVTCEECGDEQHVDSEEEADEFRFCSDVCEERYVEKRTCPECGETQDWSNWKANEQTYCSPECSSRARAKRGRAVLDCPECGESKEMEKSRVEKRTYCSRECANRARSKRGRTEFKCQECGETEWIPKNRAKNRTYCSPECATEGKKRLVWFVCAHCGDREMMPQSDAAERTYCSPGCAGKSTSNSADTRSASDTDPASAD